jgi:hypothetical protein
MLRSCVPKYLPLTVPPPPLFHEKTGFDVIAEAS